MMNCAGVLKLQTHVLWHFWSTVRDCEKAKNGQIAPTEIIACNSYSMTILT